MNQVLQSSQPPYAVFLHICHNFLQSTLISKHLYVTTTLCLFDSKPTVPWQASPPKKAALPSLEKKLKTAGLVQESLKNLLLATEDSTGQEDAELLGHIVNWETGLHPRKRWRVGTR